MRVQVLLITSYKEAPVIQVFTEDKTEQQIVEFLMDELTMFDFEDDPKPKTLVELGDNINVDFTLSMQEVC